MGRSSRQSHGLLQCSMRQCLPLSRSRTRKLWIVPELATPEDQRSLLRLPTPAAPLRLMSPQWDPKIFPAPSYDFPVGECQKKSSYYEAMATISDVQDVVSTRLPTTSRSPAPEKQ